MTSLNGPYHSLIESLSKISRLNFEIRSGEDTLLYCTNDALKDPCLKNTLNLFSKKIFMASSFQVQSLNDNDTLYGMPVINGDHAVASLIAYSDDMRNVRRSEIKEFLAAMALILEDSLNTQKEMEKMSEEMTRTFEDLYLYSRIGKEIRTLKFTGDILEDLIEDLLETMRTDIAFSRLPRREEYNAAACKSGLFKEVAHQEAFIECLLGAIPEKDTASEENFYLVNDSRTNADYKALHPDPFRFLAVKMQHKGVLYGWLGMVSFNMKEIFRRSELSLLGWMAEQMAVVIANTDLYRDLERFVVNVVKSLVYAIEAKDVYTRGHSERVNAYCMMMAGYLDMPEIERYELHWASILHDVGKIGIPENILNKPGRLTDEEYGIVKKHPRQGYDILRPIEQLSASLPGILHHHERIDGRGYPEGLTGNDIPFTAQIIAVADTFDAITSNRAYRDAKGAEKAFAVMKDVAGSQLNADLVDIFRSVYEKERHSLE